jgi:hypothetical protein
VIHEEAARNRCDLEDRDILFDDHCLVDLYPGGEVEDLPDSFGGVPGELGRYLDQHDVCSNAAADHDDGKRYGNDDERPGSRMQAG